MEIGQLLFVYEGLKDGETVSIEDPSGRVLHNFSKSKDTGIDLQNNLLIIPGSEETIYIDVHSISVIRRKLNKKK